MNTNQSNRGYPMVPPPGRCSILTVYKLEHHENQIPVTKADQAIEYGERIFAGFDDIGHCLGAIMLLLSDVPAEPLLSTNQAQKASVLGLTTLGLVLSDTAHGNAAKRIVKNSDGVIILSLSGDLEAPQFEIEVFEGREAYSRFLQTIIQERRMQQGRNSTLLWSAEIEATAFLRIPAPSSAELAGLVRNILTSALAQDLGADVMFYFADSIRSGLDDANAINELLEAFPELGGATDT